jgi:hypothetical protein
MNCRNLKYVPTTFRRNGWWNSGVSLPVCVLKLLLLNEITSLAAAKCVNYRAVYFTSTCCLLNLLRVFRHIDTVNKAADLRYFQHEWIILSLWWQEQFSASVCERVIILYDVMPQKAVVLDFSTQFYIERTLCSSVNWKNSQRNGKDK